MQRQRVLIADPDPHTTAQIGDCLLRVGHLVAGTARSARLAVQLAHQLRPDVLLLDPHLPGEPLPALARKIIETAGSAVLILTPDVDPELSGELCRAGVCGCVPRAAGPRDLSLAIAVAVHLHRRLDCLRRQADEAQRRLTDRSLIERAKGLLMLEHGLSEEEAYRRMRHLSMNRRCSLRAVAEAVLIRRELEPETTLSR